MAPEQPRQNNTQSTAPNADGPTVAPTTFNEGPVVRAVNLHPGSEDLSGSIRALAEANIQAVRINIGWHEFQPDAPHQWDDRFTPWVDAFMTAMSQQGVRVLAGVVFSPEWANGGEGKTSRNFSDEDFCGFITDVEKRWGRYIESYEIWNEAAFSQFMDGDLPQRAERYASLLKASYSCIKNLDPDKTVVGGSLYQPVNDNQNFLDMLYRWGVKDSFDVLSQHMFGDRPGDYKSYGLSKGPVSYEQMMDTVASNTVATMSRYGDGDKPIWITETGINTATGGKGHSEAYQAEELARAYDLLKNRHVANVERMYWYHLTENGAFNGTEPENRFGLMTLQGGTYRPKPAFDVMAGL